MVEVRLRAVRVDLQSNTPVLLLQESEGLGRTLPIFIGAPEATAIAFALQGMDTPRPMTHDLIRDLLDALGADVVRVVITELQDGDLLRRDRPPSRRPRDPGVVPPVGCGGRGRAHRGPAVRGRRPHGQRGHHAGGRTRRTTSDADEDEEIANPDELVGEFRNFLDSIRPEDFSS